METLKITIEINEPITTSFEKSQLNLSVRLKKKFNLTLKPPLFLNNEVNFVCEIVLGGILKHLFSSALYTIQSHVFKEIDLYEIKVEK